MKIQLRNLGPLKQAEFELGDLTIIAGANNTGKTYATYATYGFFDFWHREYAVKVPPDVLDNLLSDGKVIINLGYCQPDVRKFLDVATKQYSKDIFRVLAGKESLFEDTELRIDDLKKETQVTSTQMQISYGSKKKQIFEIVKEKGSTELVVSLLVGVDRKDTPAYSVLEHVIGQAIKQALFGLIIPRPFIASAERTGAAIFQKELDFTRNRMVEMLGDKDEKLSPFVFLDKFKAEYPVPVRKNIDFIRELSDIKNRESFIAKKHPEVLERFAAIIGGKYQVSKDGDVQYVPNKQKGLKRVRLELVESSSSVRSLLDIGFYLRHMVEPGDILMVDEPELNLHPQNQRCVARLFAQLVNLGIRVFVTTHSDYMIKEFNTLIMLHQDKRHLPAIAEREQYDANEFLNANQVRAYVAQEAMVQVDGKKRKARGLTLVRSPITQDRGIEIGSFDDAIEDMNRIQEEIIWGGDDE